MPSVIKFEEYIGGTPIFVKAASPKEADVWVSAPIRDAANQVVDITNWTWELDAQPLVVDKIGFDRLTGEPNFANSKVIGYFPKVELTDSTNVKTDLASQGIITIGIPAFMYQGPVVPDARKNVVIVVVGITYTTSDSPAVIKTNRIAIIQAWAPDIEIADPTQDQNFTALTLTGE